MKFLSTWLKIVVDNRFVKLIKILESLHDLHDDGFGLVFRNLVLLFQIMVQIISFAIFQYSTEPKGNL